MLRHNGPNALPAPASFACAADRPADVQFFALLLWIVAGPACLDGILQLAVAIMLVALINGVLAFVQEYDADRIGRCLRDLPWPVSSCGWTAARPW